MIDYSRFHSTVAVDMPPYSAKQLSELATAGRHDNTSSSISSGSDDDDADDGVTTASVRSDQPIKPVRIGSVSGPPAAMNDRRRTIPSVTRTNGISSAALAAFDLQPDDEQSFQTMIDCNRVALTTTTDGDNSAYGFF